MKRIFIIIILNLIVQSSFGQACGKYRLKYVGEISADSFDIKTVKLPTTMYLHGFEKLNSEMSFIEISPKENTIDITTYSHLTSVFTEKEALLKLYKNKTSSIPIIITIIKEGKEQKVIKEISWNNIEMKTIEDDKFGTLFEINLKTIVLAQTEKKNETELLIQKILDLPDLQWIYHSELTERLPVKILESELINKKFNLNKFGQKVIILSMSELESKGINGYVDFNKLIIHSDTVEFELSYKIEGVGSKGKLKKEEEKWEIIEYSVWEN